jgi:hypothetical protein
VTGYVLDDLALSGGLAGRGSEHERREVSRLVHDALDGGPSLDIPALCLTAVGVQRPAIAAHLAELISEGRPGAIGIAGLSGSRQLDSLLASHRHLGWPVLHATIHALITGLPILTLDRNRYQGVPVNVMVL